MVNNAIQLDQFGNGSVDSHGSIMSQITAINGKRTDLRAFKANLSPQTRNAIPTPNNTPNKEVVKEPSHANTLGKTIASVDTMLLTPRMTKQRLKKRWKSRYAMAHIPRK